MSRTICGCEIRQKAARVEWREDKNRRIAMQRGGKSGKANLEALLYELATEDVIMLNSVYLSAAKSLDDLS